ncbi:MAG: alpha/beta hydrolase fold domain-containing protein [Phycisphaerales bacterium]|nr:alpha/beta hydrolase fold domain-containing protein [Phycisphaerales bacterium]MCB9864105.1 alpha/beta hydrolase fold domain-containing protein [Phycisphaerales bacterium]
MPPRPQLAALVAIASLIAVDSIRAQPVTPAFNDVSIGIVPTDDGGTYELHTDIYHATVGAGPRPIVIWIHGGGWQSGTYQNFAQAARPLLARGIHVATADYRLSGQAIFPAQIHDVKGLVRHLRANAATYNIDPDRIGAWGSSAGGHLTALLATSGGVVELEGASGGNSTYSSRVQAAVDYFGPTNLLTMNDDVTDPPGSGIDHDAADSPESRLIGFDGAGEGIGVLRANIDNPAPPFPEKRALAALVSPMTHAGADDPALLICHGLEDRSVPFYQSVRLFQALAPLSVDVALRPVPGFGHGALGNETDEAAREFLVRRLLPRTPGDMDCDGVVDAADIVPFARLLVRPAWYAVNFPACNAANGDFNDDDEIDGGDVAGFVDALLANP